MKPFAVVIARACAATAAKARAHKPYHPTKPHAAAMPKWEYDADGWAQYVQRRTRRKSASTGNGATVVVAWGAL